MINKLIIINYTNICYKTKETKESSESMLREFRYILVVYNIHIIFIKIYTKFTAKFLEFCNKYIVQYSVYVLYDKFCVKIRKPRLLDNQTKAYLGEIIYYAQLFSDLVSPSRKDAWSGSPGHNDRGPCIEHPGAYILIMLNKKNRRNLDK